MEDSRKRYKITCPHCGKVQYACKSIAHEMGIYDMGTGSCLECGERMRLLYIPETDTMKTVKWESVQEAAGEGGET